MRDQPVTAPATGVALIDVLTTLAIATLVASSLFLLTGTTVKGRIIAHARVSDQERGRQAMAWLADRLRQVNYDADAACRDGFVRLGSGDGFAQRLAFRAVVDRTRTPARRTYVYYVDGRTLWESTLDECADDAVPGSPVALTPPIVDALTFTYYDGVGSQVTSLEDRHLVQTVGIRMTVSAPSAPGRAPESQTYATLAALRWP